jgi:hypothetical protein
MRVVHDDFQLLLAVKLLHIQDGVLSGRLLRVLAVRPFVADLEPML